MDRNRKTFWFLESLSGLFWIYMYLLWISEVNPFNLLPLLAGLSISFSSGALLYALIKLDNQVPLIGIVAGNFWVIADSLWALNDIWNVAIFLTVSRIFAVALVVLATWEFVSSRDNSERLRNFGSFFKKFKQF